MKKLLEDKIRQCEMWARFFKEILENDCEELRKCLAEDLGYEDSEDIDKHLLFSDDARNTYWKLNSGHSKTRNWLIARSCR